MTVTNANATTYNAETALRGLRAGRTRRKSMLCGLCEFSVDCRAGLCFSIGEEMGADERVDDGLVGGLDLLELDAHADAAIAPGRAALCVDIALRAGHAEPQLDRRGLVETARRAT